MPAAPYPSGNAMCVRDTGTSANSGDQYWPIRKVVRPFVRSAYARRTRSCGCSSPNGGPNGALENAPKKSGAHLPITGWLANSNRMRVFLTSPSVNPWSAPGWAWAAHSAFCPWPNWPNKPRSLNRVALMKPLMVSVSPSASLMTCCAAAGAPLAKTKTIAATGQENDAIRILMTCLLHKESR
ncbi:MAG: hypothetical protein DMD49_08360 [Gemmatimonadetes bacterium]|nr:MAG: hypothetical protein DMD49_08360 [Gemmatimonadota bacterium]